jgi:hypothetical protein
MNLPVDNLWIDIGKITGIAYRKARELEKPIRDAYLDDVS